MVPGVERIKKIGKGAKAVAINVKAHVVDAPIARIKAWKKGASTYMAPKGRKTLYTPPQGGKSLANTQMKKRAFSTL